ncbi:hypothetical protein ACUXAV_002101 [Cupriavidus metallidurans]|jgi:hypothetical protein|uniref:hypothetical protein n=1 Tax=Cupriavidus TaxID=106589 RepID=UPI00049327BC|nr:hypothetical protein [Cupriavidus metallidurans]KWW35567.1 hypothetical protein AU374_03634 [Cupriavidus metallidurans]MDE4921706.1 hypothetical protein [Cupriavidus metallidurans]
MNEFTEGQRDELLALLKLIQDGHLNVIRSALTLGALSFREFQARYNISKPLHAKLDRQGMGPPTIRAGARRLVLISGLPEWEKAMLALDAAEREHRKALEPEPPAVDPLQPPKRKPGRPKGSKDSYRRVRPQIVARPASQE